MIDINNIIALLHSMNIDISSVAVGIVGALLTQGAKKLSFVPLREGQTKTIRTVAGIATLVGVVLAAWSGGELNSPGFAKYIDVVAQAVVAYLVAHTTYKSVIYDPNALIGKEEQKVEDVVEEELG